MFYAFTSACILQVKGGTKKKQGGRLGFSSPFASKEGRGHPLSVYVREKGDDQRGKKGNIHYYSTWKKQGERGKGGDWPQGPGTGRRHKVLRDVGRKLTLRHSSSGSKKGKGKGHQLLLRKTRTSDRKKVKSHVPDWRKRGPTLRMEGRGPTRDRRKKGENTNSAFRRGRKTPACVWDGFPKFGGGRHLAGGKPPITKMQKEKSTLPGKGERVVLFAGKQKAKKERSCPSRPPV